MLEREKNLCEWSPVQQPGLVGDEVRPHHGPLVAEEHVRAHHALVQTLVDLARREPS